MLNTAFIMANFFITDYEARVKNGETGGKTGHNMVIDKKALSCIIMERV